MGTVLPKEDDSEVEHLFFFSRRLKQFQTNYSTGEKAWLSVILTLQVLVSLFYINRSQSYCLLQSLKERNNYCYGAVFFCKIITLLLIILKGKIILQLIAYPVGLYKFCTYNCSSLPSFFYVCIFWNITSFERPLRKRCVCLLVCAWVSMCAIPVAHLVFLFFVCKYLTLLWSGRESSLAQTVELCS